MVSETDTKARIVHILLMVSSPHLVTVFVYSALIGQGYSPQFFAFGLFQRSIIGALLLLTASPVFCLGRLCSGPILRLRALADGAAPSCCYRLLSLVLFRWPCATGYLF
jgi:hypothetical protein